MPDDSGFFFQGRRNKQDADVEVSISEDYMQASVTLFPPRGEGQPISLDYVLEILTRHGITHGLDYDMLADNVLLVNTEGNIIRDLVVVKGTQPVSELPEHIVLEEKLKTASVVPDTEGSIDWKSISSIIVVHEGEKLGEIKPRRDGVFGEDIFGKPIAFIKEKKESFSIGKNLEIVEDALYSTIAGRLVFKGKTVNVEETLVINKNVDYSTGHILFPGDVIIKGMVSPGFKVYSGGSIAIRDTMDAFDIQAKNDLSCGLGIIGKSPGYVRVGGNLKAKFIENARVAVRNDAEILGSIVSSSIYILGRLTMPDKGKIIGGEIYATHGIRCGFVGGKTAPITSLHVGIDFTVQQKFDQANAVLKDCHTKLSRLVTMIETHPDENLLKMKEALDQKIKLLTINIAELSNHINIDEEAVVEVKNSTYPGVIITICHLSLTVNAIRKKTRFRLDPVANKIIMEQF